MNETQRIIRLNEVFYGIFEAKQRLYEKRMDAYEAAERVFEDKMDLAFGCRLRKFRDYETFLRSYNRDTKKSLKKD